MSMSVSLTAEAQKFIEQQLRSGRYATPEEVVNAGLAVLMEQSDDFEPGEWARLLAEGEQSITRHGTLDGDEALEARRRRRAATAARSKSARNAKR